jgi:hypothetical protein
MPLPNYELFSKKVDELKDLTKRLPKSVPLALQSDKICQVFKNIPVPEEPSEHWPTFNRWMDNLFGNELRDGEGRLLYVKRGAFGMDMVVQYFNEAKEAGNLEWDIATIKVDRLIEEFKILK